jgi:hypothetical protein
MRDTSWGGTQAVRGVLRKLVGRLPSSWRLGDSASGPTLRAPDGTSTRLEVAWRKQLDPRDVPALVAAEASGDRGTTLVVAPFLSPRTREVLRDAGVSYADATGNLRIALQRPAVFIEAEGARKDPDRQPRPLASLKGPAAARVVRALCDLRPPYGIRRLAELAETPLGSVSRVVGLLDREAVVTRGPREAVADVDWPALLHRWAQDYQFLASNSALTFLEPRGLDSLVAKLRSFRGTYAVTGSLAVARRAPAAVARLAAVYVEDPEAAATALGLRAVDAGANVILARPADPVAFARTWSEDGVSHAALSQVAADLLTSPGRGPAEGEELIAWMKEHLGAWRS